MPNRGWWPKEDYHFSSPSIKPQRLTDCARMPNASPRLQKEEAQVAQNAAPQTQYQGQQLKQTKPAAEVLTTADESSAEQAADVLDWQSTLLSQVLPGFKSVQTVPSIPIPPTAQKSSQTKQSVLLYAGIFLDSFSIAKLLYWAPPVYSCLSADHLTLLYRPSAEDLGPLPLGDTVELEVTVKMHDAAVQAVSVQAPPWAVKLLRCPAHVTISTARGVQAKQAGDLVRKVQQGHIYGIEQTACLEDVRLSGRVGVKLDNGSIAHSSAEVQAALHASPAGLNNSAAPVEALQQLQAMSHTDAAASVSPTVTVTASSIATEPLSTSRRLQTTSAHVVQDLQMPTVELSNSLSMLSLQKAVHSPCTSATIPHSGVSSTHRQTSTAAVAQRAPAPVKAQDLPVQACVEVDDDDAFAAMEELDAICAPSSDSRQSRAQHPRQQQLPKYSIPSSARPAAYAHTSISAAHVSSHQSFSPDSPLSKHFRRQVSSRIQSDVSSPQTDSPKARHSSSTFRGHAGSSILSEVSSPLSGSPNSRSSSSYRGNQGGRRLWVPPPDEAPILGNPSSAAAAAPIKILKRSSTATAVGVAEAAPHSLGTAQPPLARPSQISRATVKTTPATDGHSTSGPASAESMTAQTSFPPPGLTHMSKQLDPASAASARGQPILAPPGLARKGLREPTAPMPATAPVPATSIRSVLHNQPVPTASDVLSVHTLTASDTLPDAKPLVGSPEICPTEPMLMPHGLRAADSTSGAAGVAASSATAAATAAAQSGAGDSVTSMSPTGRDNVEPARSHSPELDDLVLELQVRHLMDTVPGLVPAMAQFAIKVGNRALLVQERCLFNLHQQRTQCKMSRSCDCKQAPFDRHRPKTGAWTMAQFATKASRGSVETALSLLQEHAGLLNQLADTNPKGTSKSAFPDKQQARPQTGEEPPLPLSSGVAALCTQSSAQTNLARAQTPTSAQSSLTHVATAGNAAAQQLLTGSNDALHGMAAAGRLAPLLPARASLTGLTVNNSLISRLVHTQGSSTGPEQPNATPTPTPHGRAVYSSTDSADSVQEVLPESADAAMEAAGKVLQERNKIKGMADSERQALNMHQRACDVYYEAAKTAFDRGDKEAAQELAGKGKEHAQLAKDARSRANQAAYDSSNLSVVNRFKVDLHGMHVDEALQVLENHLLNLGGLGCPGGVLLQVITGVGKHSINGQPKILPAVVRYLSDAGYRFLAARGNPGVLDVSIGGRRSTTV